MLVNPEFNMNSQIVRILSVMGQVSKPVKLKEGVFISKTFSLNNLVVDSVKVEPFPEFPYESFDDYIATYGVCDTFEQVYEHFKDVLWNNKERKFFLSFCPVYKKDQPPADGWRWHKWGKYIGTHEIEYEYLVDEVGIKMVYCFQLHEVTGGM